MGERPVKKRENGERMVWLSLLSGIAVWSTHLLAVYALTSLACERGILAGEVAGMPALRAVHVAITGAAALIVVACMWLALGEWRRSRNGETDILAAAENKDRPFVAFIVLLLNGLFLLAVLASLVPTFVVEPC